jgi:hypothetical protein
VGGYPRRPVLFFPGVSLAGVARRLGVLLPPASVRIRQVMRTEIVAVVEIFGAYEKDTLDLRRTTPGGGLESLERDAVNQVPKAGAIFTSERAKGGT